VKSRPYAYVKITRPSYTGVLLRKRLFRLLDRSGKAHALWLTAPGGSGKTILVSTYLESRGFPCLWYQIDAGDRDLAAFFHHMNVAVKRCSGAGETVLPTFTPECLGSIEDFTREFFKDLAESLSPSTHIVFDNCQDAPSASALCEIICKGLSILTCHGLKVFFLSRQAPGGAFAGLMPPHSMEILPSEEIMFDLDECRGLIGMRFKGELTDDDVERIYEWTGGWATGIVLLVEKARRGGLDLVRGELKVESIFDYFDAEILDGLGRYKLDFLLKSSVLPNMSADLARGLTGAEDGAEILDDFCRENCFVNRRSLLKPIYQYHPLFREYLLSRLKETFPEDEVSGLYRRAVEMLGESGRTDEVIEVLSGLDDWNFISRMIPSIAPDLVAQGRFITLTGLIERAPPVILEREPWLLYWLAVSRMPFRQKESNALFQKAFALFKKGRDAAGVYLSWAGVVNSMTYCLEDLKALDRWIPKMKGLRKSFGILNLPDVEARVSVSMFMALVYRRPNHPDIEQWGKGSLELSEGVNDPLIKCLALSNYAFHKMNHGALDEALLVIKSYRRLVELSKPPPLVRMTLYWVEAMYSTYTGAGDVCLNVVTEGLGLSARTGVTSMDFLLLGQGVLSAIDAGDAERAERMLNDMAGIPGCKVLGDKGYYRYLLAFNAASKGDMNRAAEHGEIALRQALNTGFPLATTLCYILLAGILHNLKMVDDAEANLKKGLAMAGSIGYIYGEFVGLLTRALFFFDAGREKAAAARLGKALKMGRTQGFFNTYTLKREELSFLCLKALKAGLEVEYVKELIHRRCLSPQGPSDFNAQWPWHVKIFTLGRFSITVNEKPLRFERKGRQMPIMLLKTLIALGGRSVSEVQITDILWPDSDGYAAHKAFAVTLHRLRELIGASEAIILSNGKLTLNAGHCWLDLWAFERLIGRMPGSRESGDDSEIIKNLDKALTICHGDFLESDRQEPWFIPCRLRVKSKFRSAVGMLAAHYEKKNDLERAIEVYRRGIELDILAEEFYSGLMKCYMALGRKAEAAAVYRGLEESLCSIKGLAPSPRAKALYRQVLEK